MLKHGLVITDIVTPMLKHGVGSGKFNHFILLTLR